METPYITVKQFGTAFSVLILALHEKNLIDIAELPHLFEDTLTRRVVDLKESGADVAFLQELISGIQRLANHVKGSPA